MANRNHNHKLALPTEGEKSRELKLLKICLLILAIRYFAQVARGAQRGLSRNHSEQCRKRLEQCMSNHPSYKDRAEVAIDRVVTRLAKEDPTIAGDEGSNGKSSTKPTPADQRLDSSSVSSSKRPGMNEGGGDDLEDPNKKTRPTCFGDEGIDHTDRSHPSVSSTTLPPDSTPLEAERPAKSSRLENLEVFDIFLLDSSESLVGNQSDICEVYSPPRVASCATKSGLSPGWSLDITTEDPNGVPWDFDQPDCRHRAEQLIHRTQPELLILSPMCTWFSAMQNINKDKIDAKTFQKNFVRGVEHLRFCLRLADLQLRQGAMFSLNIH